GLEKSKFKLDGLVGAYVGHGAARFSKIVMQSDRKSDIEVDFTVGEFLRVDFPAGGSNAKVKDPGGTGRGGCCARGAAFKQGLMGIVPAIAVVGRVYDTDQAGAEDPAGAKAATIDSFGNFTFASDLIPNARC